MSPDCSYSGGKCNSSRCVAELEVAETERDAALARAEAAERKQGVLQSALDQARKESGTMVTLYDMTNDDKTAAESRLAEALARADAAEEQAQMALGQQQELEAILQATREADPVFMAAESRVVDLEERAVDERESALKAEAGEIAAQRRVAELEAYLALEESRMAQARAELEEAVGEDSDWLQGCIKRALELLKP